MEAGPHGGKANQKKSKNKSKLKQIFYLSDNSFGFIYLPLAKEPFYKHLWTHRIQKDFYLALPFFKEYHLNIFPNKNWGLAFR